MKKSRLKVGLALYSYNWIRTTGTERIAQELARRLCGLRQSIIDYKILLQDNVAVEKLGLPSECCMIAPQQPHSLYSKVENKIRNAWYIGIDRLRVSFNAPPLLGYLGKPWIKKWLRTLDLDMLYFPSMWCHELIRDIPIAAQLYDMQHVHYPGFWHEQYFQRKTIFGWFARSAALITTNFDFVAKDIQLFLKVPKERIAPIFLAPPVILPRDIGNTDAVIKKYHLPKRYIIYPAATWPHKNHLNLIRAIAKCVSSGLDIFCVCPGENSDVLYPGEFNRIKEEVKIYNLERHIVFPGCLALSEVYALMKGADFVCLPSFYEAGCYPIWEAAFFSKVVACSGATMIPYQIKDAGVIFDPFDPLDMARAIMLLWQNSQLRDTLGAKLAGLIKDPFYLAEKTALGYHRAFVNTLVRLGKLPQAEYIDTDPACPLDRGDLPLSFEWRELLK